MACVNAHYKTLPPKTCAICGAAFPRRKGNQVYCSPACWGKAQRKQVTKTCVRCGKAFTKPPSQAGRPYCSKQCRDADIDRKLTKLCEACGREFRVSPSMANQRFCSYACGRTVSPPFGKFRKKLEESTRTKSEAIVEAILQRHRESYVWEKRLGRHWVDFYLPDRKLVIECDEPYWHDKEKDAARDTRLASQYGVRVVRYSTADITVPEFEQRFASEVLSGASRP